MKLLTGLFRIARKRIQTKDADASTFRDKITTLAAEKDKLTDEEVSARVDELKGLAGDLPDDEEKGKLLRYLEDIGAVKGQDSQTAEEAARMVADLYERLDANALKDAPEEKAAESAPAGGEEKTDDGVLGIPGGGEKKTEDALLSVNASGNNVSAANAGAGNSAGTNDSEEDGDPLERLWQYIKRRMAEDACRDGESGEAEGVADHAMPRIPVTLGGRKAGASLSELFDKIKNGGRW